MEGFLLIALIPIIWALAAKYLLKSTISWPEMGISMGASVLIVGIVWGVGSYGQTMDHEIWNGQITSKHRDHGSYIRSYDCNCYQSCSGSGSSKSCHQVCQTCYEDHYTVKWYLKTTVGHIGLQSFDRTTRRVYDSPDPTSYKKAFKGEACSVSKRYTNYIQAVPESIFNAEDTALSATFAKMIPAYPKIHSHYKVNRIIPVGVSIPGLSTWNENLGNHLRRIGPSKQANIIILLVNTPDQSYRHALERAWLGGKKNDIIVLMGVPEYPKIAWVDTITLGANTGNELMTVMMRDELMKLKTASAETVPDTIATVVTKHFDRKAMEDYAYLADEIDPPMWVIIMAIILAFASSIGATIFFHRNN